MPSPGNRVRIAMNPWLWIGIWLGSLAVMVAARAIHARMERRRRPRTVELPNSHYTSQLVLDREAEERWKAIPLERVHEINRGEIQRLIAKVEEYGIHRLSRRERSFMDRMAELNPPPARPGRTVREARTGTDHAWHDPFGFQPPLGSRPGNR